MNASDLFSLKPSSKGMAIFSNQVINKNEVLTKFDGPVLSLDEVPDDDLPYVLRFSSDEFLIPQAPARFFNHSCNPNCEIADDYSIITKRNIDKNEELTISYNLASIEEQISWGFLWHNRWTFRCRCDSRYCLGEINGYISAVDGLSDDALPCIESLVRSDDLPFIVKIAEDIGTFTEQEIECLRVDLSTFIKENSDREAIDHAFVLRVGNEIAGLRFYGPLPMTDRSWMLFWILIAPKFHGKGYGRVLLERTEKQVRKFSGRLLLIETADSQAFTAARSLYNRCHFEMTACIPQFYDNIQGKCIFTKNCEAQ